MIFLDIRRENIFEENEEIRKKCRRKLHDQRRQGYYKIMYLDEKPNLDLFLRLCKAFEKYGIEKKPVLLSQIVRALEYEKRYITLVMRNEFIMRYLQQCVTDIKQGRQLLGYKALINVGLGSDEQSLRICQAFGRHLIGSLHSERFEVQKMSAWACGNLIGNHPYTARYLFSIGFESVLRNLIVSGDSGILPIACYTLMKYLSVFPIRLRDVGDEALVWRLMETFPSEPNVKICWALFILSTDVMLCSTIVLKNGVFKILISFSQLLECREPNIILETALLRVLANCFAANSSSFYQVLLAHEKFVFICEELRRKPYFHLQKEMIQCIANLVNQTRRIPSGWTQLESSGLLQRLSPLMRSLAHLC